jgi:hypothetical protein
LEEGYFWPFWATYERGDVNGNSCLVNTTVKDMRSDLKNANVEQMAAPATWGDI